MKVYIKISNEASDTRRVLINRTESCEKDSWEPLHPCTSIRVKVFGEEVGHIGLNADWLACYLHCERAYEADCIPHTDEIRIDALDKETCARTVKLNCVCFEVTDGADRGFKKLSISRMTTAEVRKLESMYRNAHKDIKRTEPRVFRVDPGNGVANHGVDITVFDPKRALEPGKKYFGNLHLVVVPGEIEPRFKIVSVNCSRAEAYPEYFDKSKRVYKFPSSPESSEERLAWHRLEISLSCDYAHPSNVFAFFGTFEDDKGRSHRIDGGYFDNIVIVGDSEAECDGVYAHFTSINKGHYDSREYDWYAVERTRMGGQMSGHDVLVVGVSSKKSISHPRYKATFDRVMMTMFDAKVKTPAGDHDIIIGEPKLEWPKQVIFNSRQGGKTMYLEAMLAAGVRPWDQKNAGCSVPKIERVIFNDPAVVVLWADGSKTVVKAQKGEKFDPEKGLAMAIAKKALGNGSKYYDTFKAWVPEKKKPARKPKAKKTPTEE